MGKFLDLMRATEADWDKEVSGDLPEGDYIFEFKQLKKQEERDSLMIYFVARKPLNGNIGDFRSDKYRPVPVQFNENNTWIFVKFVKDSGMKLDKVESQLPKLIGKLYSGTLKKTAGKTPNADGTIKYFLNINNLVPYNPNTTAQVQAPVSDDDESLD